MRKSVFSFFQTFLLNGLPQVALLLETKGLDFSDALSLIGPRPWLMDDLDDWIARLRDDKPHRCAAIFIDNSGVDVVLGILPFVEELLSRGTQVLLCANNKPGTKTHFPKVYTEFELNLFQQF